jgi:hypothetical protein
MFGQSRNFSKYEFYFSLIALFLGCRCSATTVIFVYTPTTIVAGADGLGIDSVTGGARHAEIKIVLIKNRFIVASIGVESSTDTRSGRKTFEFSQWVHGIEAQVGLDTSVYDLMGIVEKESSRTFGVEGLNVEKAMESGAIKHGIALDRNFARYVVAGFDNRIPTIIQTYYELDWDKNRLIGPTRKVQVPELGKNFGFTYYGNICAISEVRNPDSYAHKRILTIAPTAFKEWNAGRQLVPDNAVQMIRAWIDIETEVEPVFVGLGSRIVVLPLGADGSVTDYPDSIALTKSKTPKHKQPQKRDQHAQ